MAQGAFDDRLPTGTMEESSLWTSRYKFIPPFHILWLERMYGWRVNYSKRGSLAILLEGVNDATHCALFQKNPIDAIPTEVPGQGLDTLLHTMEIVIVTEARFHVDALLARLLMVYLPRMEIKDCRAVL